MLKLLLKPILLLGLLLFSTLFAQRPLREVNIDIFPVLQVLISRAQSDVSKEVIKSRLNERVAITRFEVNGFEIEDKFRTLVIKSFEEIRVDNKFFHLVGSIEALNKTVIVENNLEPYTAEEAEKLKNLSIELNANYYAVINISVIDKAIVLSLIIHRNEDHEIVWGKKWSTIFREGDASFNIGFYQGITFLGAIFDNNMFPFYLHLGIDKKIFTFVDLGIYLDAGSNILFPASSSSYILGVHGKFGGKLAIDLINIFNVPYKNIEFLLYARGGLNFAYNINHILPAAVKLLLFNVGVIPGIAFIINRNYAVFSEFDYLGVGSGELAFYTGFYYRFEF